MRRLPWGTGVLAGCLVATALTACSSSRPRAVSSEPAASMSSASTSATPATSATAGPPTAEPTTTASRPQPGRIPRPDHVVVVVMENHSYADILGNPDAGYINALAQRGALFAESFAVAHPSQPNYLALFSGSTQGVSGDECPQTFSTTNLASDLARAGATFAGYSEGLPHVGDQVCESGAYARKHAPWTNFSTVPAEVGRPFSDFPTSFSALPTVAFVIPDLTHDMHDGSIAEGDAWLRQHLADYASWAPAHNSLLILTFDEDDHSQHNRIFTLIVGAHVVTGRYHERLDHYRLFRTLQALHGLAPSPSAGPSGPVTDVWGP